MIDYVHKINLYQGGPISCCFCFVVLLLHKKKKKKKKFEKPCCKHELHGDGDGDGAGDGDACHPSQQRKDRREELTQEEAEEVQEDEDLPLAGVFPLTGGVFALRSHHLLTQ